MTCYKVMEDNSFVHRSIFPNFPKQCPAEYVSAASRCMDPEPTSRPTVQELMDDLMKMKALLAVGELRWMDAA